MKLNNRNWLIGIGAALLVAGGWSYAHDAGYARTLAGCRLKYGDDRYSFFKTRLCMEAQGYDWQPIKKAKTA